MGDGGQEAERVQGRREVPDLPRRAEAAGRSGTRPTGYLPITPVAYDITKQAGFYEKNPGTDVSVRQMTLKSPTPNSKGLRFGSFVQIRDVIEEEMENMLAGKQDAKTALDTAVKRGNEMLRRFEKTVRE